MKKVFLVLLITVAVSACKVLSTNLPEKPKQFNISWRVDGGMLDRSESIYISNDSCAYQLRVEGREQFVNFTLSNKILDSLYQVFYDNSFDKIETYEEEVFDRGGTSIYMNADGDSYSVSNSGMTYIKSEFSANYAKIEGAVKTITFDEISKQKRLMDIKLDSSITNSKFNVVLYVNGNSYYQEKKDGEYLTLDLSLFTMNNIFEIYFMKNDGNQNYETVDQRFDVVLEQLPVKNEILLILEDNDLIVR